MLHSALLPLGLRGLRRHRVLLPHMRERRRRQELGNIPLRIESVPD